MDAGAPPIDARPADRVAVWILITLVFLALVAGTLTPATDWQRAKNRIACVLCDEGSAGDALGNTLLFLPLGFVLARTSAGAVRTLAIATGFSVLVETVQFVVPGRDPNLGDVIFNGAGATLGWMAARSRPGKALGWSIVRATRQIVFPRENLRTWLTLGSAALVSGVLVVTCLLVTQDFPEGPYIGDVGLLDETNGPLHLGGNPRDAEFLHGVVDDVRIFGRSRTAEEIRADMREPLRRDGASVAAAEGLVAAYDFDEDPADKVADVSGHGHHGAVSGAVHVKGKFGSGLRFSGRAEEVVSIPSAPELNPARDLTIEAWVLPTAAQRALGNVLHKDGDAYFLSAGSDAGPLRSAAGVSFGGRSESLKADRPLPLNAWSHLAMTYDGSTLVFYVNGQPAVIQRRRSAARVLEAFVGSVPIGADTGNDQAALRASLMKGGSIRLRLDQARVVSPAAVLPVLSVRDRGHRSVLTIGADAADLVMRRRVVGARFGLMSPALRVHSVLEGHPSSQVALDIAADRRGYCVQSGVRHSCVDGAGLSSGWALFVDSAVVSSWLDGLFNMLWMAGLFIVPGFCAHRFAPAAVSLTLLGVTLVAVPGWLGIFPVPPAIGAVAGVAFLAGWCVRRSLQRNVRYA